MSDEDAPQAREYAERSLSAAMKKHMTMQEMEGPACEGYRDERDFLLNVASVYAQLAMSDAQRGLVESQDATRARIGAAADDLREDLINQTGVVNESLTGITSALHDRR